MQNSKRNTEGSNEFNTVNRKKMKETSEVQFLTSFFLLFKASIQEYKIFDNKISGIVGWDNEDDKQAFCWSFKNEKIFPKVKLLCDYLYGHNLIDGDSIIISEIELLSKLISDGWNENDAKKCIDYLCSIDVKMLDDNEETDSFFIHF